MYEQKEEQQMELIDRILSRENMLRALKAVKRNKGAAGIDICIICLYVLISAKREYRP